MEPTVSGFEAAVGDRWLADRYHRALITGDVRCAEQFLDWVFAPGLVELAEAAATSPSGAASRLTNALLALHAAQELGGDILIVAWWDGLARRLGDLAGALSAARAGAGDVRCPCGCARRLPWRRLRGESARRFARATVLLLASDAARDRLVAREPRAVERFDASRAHLLGLWEEVAAALHTPDGARPPDPVVGAFDDRLAFAAEWLAEFDGGAPLADLTWTPPADTPPPRDGAIAVHTAVVAEADMAADRTRRRVCAPSLFPDREFLPFTVPSAAPSAAPWAMALPRQAHSGDVSVTGATAMAGGDDPGLVMRPVAARGPGWVVLAVAVVCVVIALAVAVGVGVVFGAQ